MAITSKFVELFRSRVLLGTIVQQKIVLLRITIYTKVCGLSCVYGKTHLCWGFNCFIKKKKNFKRNINEWNSAQWNQYGSRFQGKWCFVIWRNWPVSKVLASFILIWWWTDQHFHDLWFRLVATSAGHQALCYLYQIYSKLCKSHPTKIKGWVNYRPLERVLCVQGDSDHACADLPCHY